MSIDTLQLPVAHELARRIIDVELLALDLRTCTHCVETLENIETAIKTVQQVLEVTAIDVQFQKILIESDQQAREHQFVTSPTVRINRRDIAFERLESACETCTGLCGCAEGTTCRIWRYRGQEFTQAPVGLIVEALLREIVGSDIHVAAESPVYEGVPENLRRFFTQAEGSTAERLRTFRTVRDQIDCRILGWLDALEGV
jgi:glutaredoxin